MSEKLRGSKFPKTAPVEKSQPNRKRLKMLNNFVITQSTPIVVMCNPAIILAAIPIKALIIDE